MTTSIWWIRRDLRLSDNQTLHAAQEAAQSVVPLFILDPALLSSSYVGAKRLAFLFDGLRALDRDLKALGSRLIVREGRPADVIAELLVETSATAVFAEEDVSPYARDRDAEVAERVPLQLCNGLTVFPPELIQKDDGDPYTVFTPFSKAWKALSQPRPTDLLPAPTSLQSPPDLHSLAIPQPSVSLDKGAFLPGETEGQQRLREFTAAGGGIVGYGEGRNMMDRSGTSQLSPYLRFGMVSMRQAAVAARQALAAASNDGARKGAQTWLNELIWREFYLAILYYFPHVMHGSFRPKYDAIVWENDPQKFEAWCEGRTGYPIVDAAMRQLAQTGWMHNRGRMIVASFLVKDLLIDWRWGERWFMQHLIDGDPASNNGGWQWTAGTGTDAAPYFRVFNPYLQSVKFDPDGRFIRQWLPELAEVPDDFVHEPSRMSPAQQESAGCLIGRDYPQPIVDHSEARKRALAAYKLASTT